VPNVSVIFVGAIDIILILWVRDSNVRSTKKGSGRGISSTTINILVIPIMPTG
jgi:hypothetical protein